MTENGIQILFIRHSLTAGNLKGRYIGSRTDEPLCAEGFELLDGFCYPHVDAVYASPMKRCVETAGHIWPELCGQIRLTEELRECDFGDFENKNYEELNVEPYYQAWIDSGGRLPFPNGESVEDFKSRCVRGFAKIVREFSLLEIEPETGHDLLTAASGGKKSGGPFRAAIVAHGGTIMAVMEKYGYPKRGYFDYQVKNGRGYLLTPARGTKLWNYRCWP